MMLNFFPWLLLPLMPMQAVEAPPPVVVEQAEVACPEGFTCVVEEDMGLFLQLLRDHKCRETQPPTVTADSLTIITDRQGRVYGSGTGPKPYTLKISWCNYEIEAKSEIHLDVAQWVEPTWGFRFRVKATAGVLLADAFVVDKLYEALDGGVLVEPFFIQWANLNAHVGFRSFGAGVGFDPTLNSTIYLGYALTWGSWRSNPFLSVGFSLW